MFVERFECADEDASVLQDTAHPEVDVLQHLTALTDRLERVQHSIKDAHESREHWPQVLVVNRTFILQFSLFKLVLLYIVFWRLISKGEIK